MQLNSDQPVQVNLEMNGQAWEQVGSFEHSGPGDRHFVVEQSGDGKATLRFGDGEHGARPPSGAERLNITYEKGSGYVGVIMQQGPVQTGNDPQRYYGLYRGIVTANLDPENRLRVMVQVPDVLGQTAAWALPCLPPVGAAAAPAVGKLVWVMFEHGDPDYPVWMGSLKLED